MPKHHLLALKPRWSPSWQSMHRLEVSCHRLSFSTSSSPMITSRWATLSEFDWICRTCDSQLTIKLCRASFSVPSACCFMSTFPFWGAVRGEVHYFSHEAVMVWCRSASRLVKTLQFSMNCEACISNLHGVLQNLEQSSLASLTIGRTDPPVSPLDLPLCPCLCQPFLHFCCLCTCNINLLRVSLRTGVRTRPGKDFYPLSCKTERYMENCR